MSLLHEFPSMSLLQKFDTFTENSQLKIENDIFIEIFCFNFLSKELFVLSYITLNYSCLTLFNVKFEFLSSLSFSPLFLVFPCKFMFLYLFHQPGLVFFLPNLLFILLLLLLLHLYIRPLTSTLKIILI